MSPDLFVPPPEYPPRSPLRRDCTACGACCSAPDIHALRKPLGMPCPYLNTAQDACLCQVYTRRPQVCRNYQPDWVCGEVAPLPTLPQRIARFLEIYGLQVEALALAGGDVAAQVTAQHESVGAAHPDPAP